MHMSTTDSTPPVPLPALLHHARKTYGSAMRAALERAGHNDIPKNGLYVLGGLALNSDQPFAEIIASLDLPQVAAEQLLDILVERGYLARGMNAEDRRLTVTLSVRGHAAAKVQAIARDQIDRELLARVGEQNVESARRVLLALIVIGREAGEV
jgi:DNA-binding MarR family transcriptional regulator